MPKLKSIVSRAYASDVHFTYEYPTSVFATGQFIIEVPEDQVHVMLKFREKNGFNERIGYEKSPRSGKHQFSAATLSALEKLVNQYAEWMVTGVKTKETRLYYRTNSFAHYWIHNDGTIYPNGYDEKGIPRPEGSGVWAGQGGRNSWDTKGTYEIGLGAIVCDRVTTQANTGDRTISFERAELAAETYGHRLNRFCHVGLWPGARSISDKDENTSMRWLPYTEERAKFFYDAMIAVCTLADRFDQFFGQNSADLLSSLEKGGRLLASPEKSR
jgi:hypothetical protein